jgi:hypothetical protein
MPSRQAHVRALPVVLSVAIATVANTQAARQS